MKSLVVSPRSLVPISTLCCAFSLLLWQGSGARPWHAPSALLVAISSVIAAVLLLFGLAFVHARLRRCAYHSGNIQRVLAATASEAPEEELRSPLSAFALASVGDTQWARRMLLGRPGHASEEARELELCARIVVLALDGDHEESLALCQTLESSFSSTPTPASRRFARRRGTVAVARTRAGCAELADLEALEESARAEPMMYWLCRYSAALFCIRRNAPEVARRLIAKTPPFSESSVFRKFQSDILACA